MLRFIVSNIIDISDYSPKQSDSFFFDNNIWIYLLYPLSRFDKKQQKVYSSFLSQMLSARSTVFVNSLVLSEFINLCLRFDYNQWKRNPENISNGSDYKRNYLGCSSYKKEIENITTIVGKILKLSEKFPDNFTSIDIGSVLNNLKLIDFNDSYYIELFKNKDIKIVTHDADFFNQRFEVDILTANRNY